MHTDGETTPDQQIVIAGGHDSVLRIWNGANGQVLHTLEAPLAPGAEPPESGM